ncbi:MAG TPA: hypothetical protein VFX17_03880 [Patescibacteria group bacterium]|nr:hypothetical protein [Patescibacteria group bacterium]
MTRNRIIGIIVLIVIVAVGAWLIYDHNHKSNSSNTNPNLSVSVQDQTQNADGTTITAHPNDSLIYTLTAQNPTDKVISGFVIEVGIGDVTNVATLIDAQGANYNSGNNSLIWTPLDIPANGSIQKQFTVRVKDPLPTDSAQRVAKVSYNNQVITNLGDVNPSTQPANRPGTLGSGTSFTAPKTGIPGWISVSLAAFITLGVFLFRVAYKLGKPNN